MVRPALQTLQMRLDRISSERIFRPPANTADERLKEKTFRLTWTRLKPSRHRGINRLRRFVKTFRSKGMCTGCVKLVGKKNSRITHRAPGGRIHLDLSPALPNDCRHSRYIPWNGPERGGLRMLQVALKMFSTCCPSRMHITWTFNCDLGHAIDYTPFCAHRSGLAGGLASKRKLADKVG